MDKPHTSKPTPFMGPANPNTTTSPSPFASSSSSSTTTPRFRERSSSDVVLPTQASPQLTNLIRAILYAIAFCLLFGFGTTLFFATVLGAFGNTVMSLVTMLVVWALYLTLLAKAGGRFLVSFWGLLRGLWSAWREGGGDGFGEWARNVGDAGRSGGDEEEARGFMKNRPV